MHRIDGPGATVDNKFTEGDPVSAVPATEVTDDWLNDVQENVCKIIEDAGIALFKGDSTQLKAAVAAMITAAIPSSPPDASETVKGIVELATVAEAVTGTDTLRATTPAGLNAARMRRIARLSSATVQAVSGANTSPQVFSPLSYSFTADGGLYSIRVKLNANIQTDSGTGPSNAVVFKLLNGATPLDISAANITGSASWQGDCFVLEWSGTLSGAVALTVTFEKTYGSAIGSLSINGDRDDLTSNVSGQLSSIDIYRMGA